MSAYHKPKKPSQAFLDYIDSLECKPARGILYGKRDKPIGSPNNNGIFQVGICVSGYQKMFVRAHLIWYKYYGEWPTKLIIHKNRKNGDDRIDNLEAVDSQNTRRKGKEC